MVCFNEKMLLNTHISELDTQLYPSIPKWSLTYIQAANLPGYYETRTNTTIHIINTHNFSNVLSTMRVPSLPSLADIRLKHIKDASLPHAYT